MQIQLKQRLLSSIKLSTRIRCHIKMSVSVFLLSKFRVACVQTSPICFVARGKGTNLNLNLF